MHLMLMFFLAVAAGPRPLIVDEPAEPEAAAMPGNITRPLTRKIKSRGAPQLP